MPGSFNPNPGGVRNTRGLPVADGFMNGDSPYYEYPYAVNLTAVDNTGALVANADVTLFRTADDSVAAIGTSDAAGAIRLGASPVLTHYLVAYKAGSPDVAGTTVNTLVGS